MKLDLKKFDLKRVKDDSVVLFIGKRNTGKSFCLTDMLFHNRSIPVGVVISPTESANRHFGKFVPGMLIHEEWDPEIVTRFVDRQKAVMNQLNEEQARYGRTDIDPRAFIVLDDCLYDKGWQNDKNIRQLFMNGRHLKSMVCITMQYPLGVPPVLRTNVDYVFIFRENQVKNRERIYEQYAGMFGSFDAFSQVMNACTSDYKCLVIDNKTQSNELSDQVFWYKAEARPSFRMCCPELWAMEAMEQERRVLGITQGGGADAAPEEPTFNPAVIKKKSNSPTIRVNMGY